MSGPLFAPRPARAARKYGPGVTDTEIKIGNTGPCSGPASSYSAVPKSQAAYWRMIKDQGGINGRKINFISARLGNCMACRGVQLRDERTNIGLGIR